MTNKKNDNNQRNEKTEKAYDHKFMMNWAESEPPEHFAGDAQTDDFTNDNDYDKNLDLRMTSPMGGPFMHPMHDATLDTYSNDLDLQVDKPIDEEKEK